MIVIRQSTVRTSIAMGVLVVVFAALGAYGLLSLDSDRGRTVGVALLGAAAVLAVVSVRSIMRGTIVAVLRSDGLELHSGHFARWGPIRWDHIEEVFLFRSVGLRMIGVQLTDPQRYLRRSPAWVRWSLWLDRQLASGADAHLSASAVRAQPDELGRLIRIFLHSPAVRAHFGRGDVVLEFPTDVSLAEVLALSAGRGEDDSA